MKVWNITRIMLQQQPENLDLSSSFEQWETELISETQIRLQKEGVIIQAIRLQEEYWTIDITDQNNQPSAFSANVDSRKDLWRAIEMAVSSHVQRRSDIPENY